MTISIFILGLAVGSFLNAYIFRMHDGGSVWHGRSYCPKCKKPLSWHELIPFVAFILQRGRCRGCKQRIDLQYPLVELTTGILFVLAWLSLGTPQDLAMGVSWYLLAVLVILFVYDLRYGLVPDRVVLPAIGVAFVYNVILNVVKDPVLLSTGFLATLGMAILAILVGALFFAFQYYLSCGRWLGAGDIRIGALMGAMLGWPLVLVGLVVSYISGGAVALGLIAVGKKRFGQTLPLGTFLALGTAVVFLYGEQIWQWYWR